MSDDMIIRPDAFQTKRMPTDPREEVIPPKQVLERATEVDLRQVFIVGLLNDGRLFAASSHSHIADNVLLIERVRRHVLSQFDDDSF